MVKCREKISDNINGSWKFNGKVNKKLKNVK